MIIGASKILNPYRWQLSTYQILVLGFAGIILGGAMLLMTPYAANNGAGLSFIDATPLFPLLFEVTSAFGTVGLSTGITPQLSAGGKVLITLTMFAGRVGTLTLLMALALRPRKERLKYPEGKIVIG